MVRQKTRWLLVRIHYEGMSDRDSVDRFFPLKKELFRAIHDNLIRCFGIATSGAVLDTQVRFLDVTTMLALIRVPRDLCNVIRSSLTLLSELQNRRIAISILSVNGSARTAKVVSIRNTRHFYRERLSSLMERPAAANTSSEQKELDRTCRSMEEAIETISNIDY